MHSDFSAYRNKLCLDQAVQWGAKVVNMSFWSQTFTSQFESSVIAANAAGVIMVVMAGNFNDRTEYPAAFANTLAVGGHDKTQVKAHFGNGNYSNTLNVQNWAPAKDVPVAVDPGVTNSKFKLGSGTSFASPIVAGICAVAVQRGKISNYSTAVTQLQNKGNSYTCGKAVDAIWTVR